ncbi:MAG TPA: alpha-L-rhamnosidase C-terminal domain-containing protein [Terriglobia bacterium]|nr:alpha-L-rhamnosidase C-terminal domain-containing protein [Terriglobia bacterium]
MLKPFSVVSAVLFFASLTLNLSGQSVYRPNPLDLTAEIRSPKLESELHHPLPEQYIWVKSHARRPVEFWNPLAGNSAQWVYFRRAFDIGTVPQAATLYVAGPAQMRVYLNGKLLANARQDSGAKIHPYVLVLDVSHALGAGQNTLALAVAHGRRLAVKIVPRPAEVNGPAILTSGRGWIASTQEQNGWEQPGFSESGWQDAAVLGGIESNINFFQANQDAGMYRWPGYDGISPFLARIPVRAAATLDIFPGLGAFHNVEALAAKGDQLSPATVGDFTVDLPHGKALASEYPSLVLDFGRESTGRLEVVSDSDAPMRLAIQYGESLGETLREPYLGVDDLAVPPHATAYGPKSAFRYAKVTFLNGASPLRFKTIQLDDIYYPVKYRGSFESSDPLLNRIWQLGAYTSHLCMQDDIWDAPKRDRARWMGDLDVSGHVIDAVFADHFLMQETMDALIRDAGQPVDRDVNHIPGYSAFWVMGEADYYEHFGDLEYLRSLHQPLIQLLDYMASEMDSRSVFTNRHHAWPYVDWSPGLSPSFSSAGTRPLSETAPNAQRGTQFEFYAAFKRGAWLLRQLGDSVNADRFDAKAKAIRSAALKYMLDPQTGTFGDRWQPNAMAIYSGLADEAQTQTIWQKVLSHPDKFRITPYYNFYVISAMALAGQYKPALDWIRKYWGGMVRRGATSTWEAYELGLPKQGWHRRLRADFGQGYFVSLAHGWSSGPTIWLMEEILGIKPTKPGFTQVQIRPELAGLQWARGTEPTPRGMIRVDYRAASGGGLTATLDLPPGTQAEVSMPVSAGKTAVQLNGQTQQGVSAEDGQRAIIHFDHAGRYTLVSK